MTTTEYLALRKTLCDGCMPERRDFIDEMEPRQLFEFIDFLVFNGSDFSQLETWRYLAKVAAIRALDYVARVDGSATLACGCPVERAERKEPTGVTR